MNTITRRNELRPMDWMNDMDPFRMMRSLLPLTGSVLPFGNELAGSRSFIPAVDIWEEKDRIMLKADLPGFREEDVEVTIDGEVLRLSGKREAEKVDHDTNYHLVQRSSGRFNVAYTLPYPVKPESVVAELKNGELSVVFPRTSSTTEAKKISLKKSSVKA